MLPYRGPRLLFATASLAALIIGVAPLAVAADSGGVLPWTQWAAGVACVIAAGLAIAGCLSGPQPGNWRRHAIALLLFLTAGFAWLQSAALAGTLVRSVAPGSAEAYSAWLSPLWLVPEDAALVQDVRPRISVDQTLSRAAAWLTAVIAAYALLASQLFTDRWRVQYLLLAIALAGALQSGLGIYQLLTAPDATVWGIRSHYGGKPFGTFVNRSNAAVMLNIGLACSLGIVAWRLAALTGTPLNGDRFPFDELLDVAFDRLSIFALLTASLCVVGLLFCGSRSGLVGLVGGLMLAFGMVQSANRWRGLLATCFGIAMMAAIVMVNLDLSALSAERLGSTAETFVEKSELQEARFSHWRDGFAAAIHQPLVGWGWGAYRYAYLPFQSTGAGAWFINADNLWLEVFVEAGLVGLVLLVAAILVIIRNLLQLALSSDPLDHGLAVTGWFILGSMAASQLFDFGLRIPANSLLVAVLLSVVVTRRYSAGTYDVMATTGKSFRLDAQLPRPAAAARWIAPGSRLASLTVVGLALVTALGATAAMSQHAAGDKVIRMAKLLSRDRPEAIDAAQQVAQRLSDYLAARPQDSEALAAWSQLQFDLARMRAAQSIAASHQEQSVNEVYQQLTASNLRSIWHSRVSQTTAPLFSDDHSAHAELQAWMLDQRVQFGTAVQAARAAAAASLTSSPLSPEARFVLVTLDFCGGDPKQTSELLQQAARLRKQNPQVLIYIGDLAVEAGDWTFAASAWQRAAYINGTFTTRVLRRVASPSPLRPSDVVPDTVHAHLIAAKVELAKPAPDTALLDRAVDTLSRSLPEEQTRRAARLQQIAKIQRKLGRHDDAAATLLQATRLHPRNVELRYERASVLVQLEKLDEAREEASVGQQLAPHDTRFEKMILSVARLEEAARTDRELHQ